MTRKEHDSGVKLVYDAFGAAKEFIESVFGN